MSHTASTQKKSTHSNLANRPVPIENTATDQFNIPSDMDYLHASSNQEFTGLVPAGKGKEDELEDYSEIFPFYEKIPLDTHKKDFAK